MQSNEPGGVTTFFQAYERAIQTNDAALLRTTYADSFLFGGPQGSQSVKLEEFLNVVPRRAEAARTYGVTGTHLVSLTESPMDAHYVLVRAVWQIEVRRPDAASLLPTEASYVLRRFEDSFRIVAQIDHQDLLENLKALNR